MTAGEHENRKAMTVTDLGVICCGRSFLRLNGLYDHFTGAHRLEPEQAQREVEQAREAVEEERRAFLRKWKAGELEKLRLQGPRRAQDWTLDSFPAADVEGRRALKAARQWIEGGGILRHPRLYVHGPPGGGKTGLAYGVARAWISDGRFRRIEFENVRVLLERQRGRFARGKGKKLDHLLRDPDPEKLIVLDDLGADRPTEFAVDTIALIIERLHAADVPLIVTTNYAPSELAKRIGHADPIAGARIVSRLREDGLVIPLNRSDLRMRTAA
jgi:DNA replication protein DnaC